MDWVSNLLSSDTKILSAALVSAIVSAIVSASIAFLFKRFETRDKLSAEYEHEQRKKIKELIGRYHGRLLRAANSLNYRFWNLYANKDKQWLAAGGKYSDCGYYLLSFSHRLLNVLALARQFEKEAIYLDSRIARPEDFAFLNYVDAMHWVLTDVALFKGLPYDTSRQTDHFYADRLRSLSESCWAGNDVITIDQLKLKLREDRALDELLQFLDSLTPDEQRYRWDRLVSLHLLLAAFINKFGYKTHKTTDEQFKEIIMNMRHKLIVSNLVSWLSKLGLSKDKEAKKISRAYRYYEN